MRVWMACYEFQYGMVVRVGKTVIASQGYVEYHVCSLEERWDLNVRRVGCNVLASYTFTIR